METLSAAAQVDAARLTDDAEFWPRFAREHWEREPLRIAGPPGAPLLSEGELFDGLVAAAERYREAGDDFRAPHERTARLRLLVDRAARLNDVEGILPAQADGGLAGFHRRAHERLGGRPFELIANDFQEHSPALFARLKRFLRGLYAQVGLPAQRAEAAVFLRDHAVTSFGVHRDDASVFLFVLSGRKRILAWPPGSFDPRAVLSTVDYERLRASAVVLEGEPGDVLYWPSSYWHVGEADDGLSVSVNLGLHLGHRPAGEIAAAAARLAEEGYAGDEQVDTYAFDPDDPRGSAGRLPPAVSGLAAAMAQAVAAGALERSLRLAWLNQATGYGFRRVPAAEPRRPVAEGDLVARAGEPLVFLPWGEGEVACSADGRSFAVPSSPGLLRLLRTLDGGAPWRAGDLLDACARGDGEERRLLGSVLARLRSLRALLVIEERSR